MSAAEVDVLVITPIESTLSSAAGLRHTVSEASSEHARIVLEFDPGRSEAAMQDFLARSNELGRLLPEGVSPPMWQAAPPPGSFLRVSLESEVHDLGELAAVHAKLVERSLGVWGVVAVEGCAPHSRVVIELDPERLRAHGLDPAAIEAALREELVGVPNLGAGRPELDIEALRAIVIAREPEPITLTRVAALRYGFADPECVAASATGIAASATFGLESAEARTKLEAELDAFERSLPPALELRRFGPEDTRVELSLAAELSPEQGAESIGAHLGSEPEAWLVEVGVEGELCVGSGVPARLSFRGHDRMSSVEPLLAIPGVTEAELAGRARERHLWILGPEPERVAELARAQAQKLRAVPGLARVDLYTAAPEPQVRVEPDRHALAKLGLGAHELAHQLRLARDGVEIAKLVGPQGVVVPLVLSFARPEDDAAELEQLRQLVIHGEQPVPLSTLAALRLDQEPGRICRYDGRPGIILALEPAQPDAWPRLRRQIEAELPADGSWAWAAPPP